MTILNSFKDVYPNLYERLELGLAETEHLYVCVELSVDDGGGGYGPGVSVANIAIDQTEDLGPFALTAFISWWEGETKTYCTTELKYGTVPLVSARDALRWLDLFSKAYLSAVAGEALTFDADERQFLLNLPGTHANYFVSKD
jgi:hypothetical protein